MAQIDFNATGNASQMLDASSLAARDYAVLRGANGNDTLIGSSGNDRLDGGGGNDSMAGGDGDDRFFLTYSAAQVGRDSVDGGAGNDMIVYQVAASQMNATIRAELVRLEQYVTAGDFSSRFISDVLRLDFTDVDTAVVRVDGTVKRVADVIAGPVATADSYAASEDTLLTVNTAAGVLANDSGEAGGLRAQAGSIATAQGGTVVMAADGSFTFLGAANFVGNDSFSYTLVDGLGRTTTGTATVTVADVATEIGGTATGTLTEDTALPATGTLTVTGQAAGFSGFQAPASLAGTYGSFQFNTTTGAWSYFLATDSAAVQALDDGDSVTDTLTVGSADGTATQAITVTVTGANDGPSITSGDGSGAPYELAGSYLGSGARGFLEAAPALGDLDGDGRTDLVVGSGKYGGPIGPVAFRNTPDGFLPFAADPFAGLGLNSSRVALGDIDGDGRADLLALSGGATTLAAYQNTGSGFAPFAVDPLGAMPFTDRFALGDIDGDGRADLIVQDSSTFLGFRNTGSGFEAFATNPFAGIPTNSVAGAALGDLDGDGRLDLVLGTEQGGVPAKYGTPGNALLAYQNTGSGFVPFAASPLPQDLGALGAMPAFGDIDGDGTPDLVVGNKYGGLNSFRNTGSGFVSLDTGNPLTGAFGFPQAVDLDGDGDLDIMLDRGLGSLSSKYGSGSGDLAPVLTSLENTGTGFQPFATDPFGGLSLPLGDMRFVDLDSDGDLDAVGGGAFSAFYAEELIAFENTGSGFVPLVPDNPLEGTMLGAAGTLGLTAIDIDGDGVLDLVGNNGFALVAARGTGTGWQDFEGNPLAGIDPGEGPTALSPHFAFDLDGDGDQDLVAATKYGQVRSLENVNGTFQPFAVEPLGNAQVGLFGRPVLADIDGDGDPDILLGRPAGDFSVGAPVYLENNGGDFSTARELGGISVGASARYTVLDVNNDGRPDIVISDLYGATRTYFNAGSGFQEGGTGIAYQATAVDPEGDSITWSLGGADAAAFSIDAGTGAVTFNSAPDFEAPADAGGDNLYEIDVIASDGTASTSKAVKIFVSNVNEAAAITGDSTGTVTEDGTLTASGTLVATDPDNGQSFFQWPVFTVGDYGNFDFNARTGEWFYGLDNANTAVQALADGQTLTDTLRVFSLDGTAFQDITVTITGANERAIGTATGLFRDVNQNGTIDAGETTAVVFNGAGKNADLATQAWTIEYESKAARNIDITGFDADDKIALDVVSIYGPVFANFFNKAEMVFNTRSDNNYLTVSKTLPGGTTGTASINVFWNPANLDNGGQLTVQVSFGGPDGYGSNYRPALWNTANNVLIGAGFLSGPQFEFVLPP